VRQAIFHNLLGQRRDPPRDAFNQRYGARQHSAVAAQNSVAVFFTRERPGLFAGFGASGVPHPGTSRSALFIAFL
jgi:hypothetical protein